MKAAAFSKTYGDRTVLTMPELELTPGRICAVIGANGSGKSTLARVLSGALPADGGRAVLPSGAAAGYMPQQSYAFRMSVRANVLLAGSDRVRADRLLERLGLLPLARRRANRLSGGETARMALARTMMRRYELLILDEPTAAMDMAATILAERLIAAAAKEEGSAVLLVTHSLQQARRIADEALFLQNGELAERGPAAQILFTPKRHETQEFLDFYA